MRLLIFAISLLLLLPRAALAAQRDEREDVLSARMFHIMKIDREPLQRLYSRLKAVPKAKLLSEFKRLANAESIDPGSNTMGGDLGVVAEGAMDLRFEKAAFALEEDVVSQPVQSSFGWHLILIRDISREPVAPICASTLEAFQREMGGMSNELVQLSLRTENRDFHPDVLPYLGKGWGRPLKWEENLSYARVEPRAESAGTVRITVHSELTYALFHDAPRSCTRSVQNVFAVDCKNRTSGLASRTEFEGRAASGRKLRHFDKADPEMLPVMANTFGTQLEEWACNP